MATVNPDHLGDTMPVNSRTRRTRPISALAYYLGRPARLWTSFTIGQMEAPEGRW